MPTSSADASLLAASPATAEPASRRDEDLAAARRLGEQLARFLRLAGRSRDHLPDVYREGVEKVGHVLLSQLESAGPRRATELADAVHSDISTISRQVTTLVQLGWIERTPDPADGRAFLLAITGSGRQVLDRIRRCRDTHTARALRDWSPAERTELTRLMARLNDDMESYLRRVHECRDLTTPGELNTREEEDA